MASRPIDEKIVVMKLDNSDFKQKAVETTGLFGKLKDSLNKIPGVNLGKTVKDLNGISTAAKGSNLNGLATAAQNVGSKFSAMSVIATTALATIVNRATNAGMRLAKSLSMEQVTAGFQEYELKMGSIQTILANTAKHGTKLEDVSKALGELNDYADKTIYNFGDMTRNIGLFTNAGLKLEESTSMIKGFSNAAAASGTSAEGASGAAYQLSQALSAGTIRLMDWRSLTNVGMGNKNMQEGIVDIATAMGAFEGTGISATEALKDFNGSLEKNWLSADVMSKYLQIMAKDLDATEMASLGLTEAQIKLFEEQSTTAEEAATKVRTFSQLMDTLKEGIGSGWAVTFESIFGDFNEATELFSTISDKIGVVIGKSSDARNKFITEIADGGGFLNIFDGISNVMVPVTQVFGALGKAFKEIFPPTSAATIIKVTESFKSLTDGLQLGRSRLDQITTIFKGVFSIFSSVWEIVKRLGAAFVNLIPEGSGKGVLKLLQNIALLAIGFNTSLKEGNALTGFIDKLGVAFKGLSGFLSDVGGGVVKFAGFIRDNLGTAINWVKEALAPVGAYFKEAFGGSYGDEAIGAGFLIALFAMVKKIKGFFDGDFDIFESIQGMVDGVSEAFGGIGEAINNFATSIKYVNLILIATAIGILAVALKVLEGISVEDLSKGLAALALSLGVMIAGMVVISKFNPTGGLRASVTLIALATAVTIMAGALKLISDLDTNELIKGVSGLAAIVATLSIAMIAMSKFGGKVQSSSLQLIALAGTIVILASAIKIMSEIDTADLFISIGALTLIFAGLAAFLKVADGVKFGVGSALGVIAIAGAVILMTSAIQTIATIDVEGLVKGLATITLILLAVAGFAKIAGGPQILIAGAGLLLIAGAINALVGPITTFSEMTWEELAKGMAGMAASLLILAGAAMLMTGGLAGVVGVIAMAAGLQLLIGPVERFAAMTWTEMLKGFAGMAIAMGLMAGAALLLTPAVPSMLGFGAAIALMGIAMLAAGAGMALFGMGLTTLASLTVVSIASIISALSLLIQGLGTIIGDIVSFVVELGVALLDGIGVLIPKLVEIGWKITNALIEGLDQNLPNLIEKGANIIVNFIDGMALELPRIIAAAAELMTALSESVTANAPIFLNAWLDIMAEVASIMVSAGAAVIDALFGWIPGVGDVTSKIGGIAELNIREAFEAEKVAIDKGNEFTSGLASTQGGVQDAGIQLGQVATLGAALANLNPTGVDAGMGYSTGISSTSGTVQGSGEGLANSAETGASTANLNPIGTNAGQEFVGGLNSRLSASSAAGTGLATSGRTGAGSVSLTSTGQQFGQGFANGMSSKTETIISVGKGLARAASNAIKNWLDIRSPSRVTTKQGEHTGQGLANGIASKKKTVAKSAKDVAAAANKSFKSEMDTASYKFKMEKIDSVQYIAELNKIKKSYSKYPQMVQKVDLEIKKIRDKASKDEKKRIEDAEKKREEAEKKRLEDIKKRFEAEKKVIDDRKYYNDMSLLQELKAYQAMNVKYAKGSEERKEIEREIYRLKNELNDKMMAINDEYVAKIQDANQKLIDGERELNEEYTKALEDRTNALAGFAGIFDKVSEASEVSGKELVDNLKGQVVAFRNWASDIQILATRGIDEGLLEELRQMGPKSAAEIAALTQLTSDELNQYSYLWKTKNELARTLATKELEDMKKDTAQKIEELRKDTAKQLEEYQKEWAKKIKEINTGTKDQFIDLKAAMTNIGGNTIRGLMDGMKNMEGPLKKQAQDMAKGIADTIRKALEIKSPSRVTTRFGEFIGEGLANGMARSIKRVNDSARNVAQVARDSILDMIDGIMPDDNTFELDVVVNTDGLDMRQFRDISVPVNYIPIPDTSFTEKLFIQAAAFKASIPDHHINKKDKIKTPEPVVPMNVSLEYHGSGGEEDAVHMVDIIERELGSRVMLTNAMRGVSR